MNKLYTQLSILLFFCVGICSCGKDNAVSGSETKSVIYEIDYIEKGDDAEIVLVGNYTKQNGKNEEVEQALPFKVTINHIAEKTPLSFSGYLKAVKVSSLNVQVKMKVICDKCQKVIFEETKQIKQSTTSETGFDSETLKEKTTFKIVQG